MKYEWGKGLPAVSIALGLMLSLVLPAQAASPVKMFLDKGVVTPFYGRDLPDDPLHLADAVKRAHFAERMASVAGSSLLFKRDLKVGFESCGVTNAFFEPSRSAIIICYEWVQLTAALARNDTQLMAAGRDQFSKMLDGALWGVFLHELGHAVVRVNGVPITGREEDVADQFGTWYALNFFPVETQPVIVPSLWLWMRMAQHRNLPDLPEEPRLAILADEHSLDQQRVFNIACMGMGARPATAQGTMTLVHMPQERADNCPSEYAQVDQAMRRNFKKFFKIKPRSGSW